MSQNKLKFNGVEVIQPDTYTAAMATTSSEDSGRDMLMTMHNTILGTAEAFSLEWSDISAVEASKILKQVVNKSHFTAHYFSLYYGEWRDGEFYAANFNTPVRNLIEGTERWEKLAFQITGVNPL